jgi:hypothetical protein
VQTMTEARRSSPNIEAGLRVSIIDLQALIVVVKRNNAGRGLFLTGWQFVGPSGQLPEGSSQGQGYIPFPRH